MSNHGETTPGGNQPPDPKSGGGNNTPVDDTPVRDTSQKQAIVITDGDNVSRMADRLVATNHGE